MNAHPAEHAVIGTPAGKRPKMSRSGQVSRRRIRPSHPLATAATVTDVMRSPLTTAQQHDHATAATYLMKHAGTTALMVVDARAG